MTPTHFSASVTPLEIPPDAYATARCPACGAAGFGFHQPDTRKPERLLAVCDGCGEWFLFDLRAALIIQVPGAGRLSPARRRDGEPPFPIPAPAPGSSPGPV